MYVCVAENAELLVFLHLSHRQFSFRREVLNHHTPPPIPKQLPHFRVGFFTSKHIFNIPCIE